MIIKQKEDTSLSEAYSNDSSKMKNLVNEILISSNSKIDKQKQRIKRFKWNQYNIQLFQELYKRYLGDLDMIHQYFQKNTEFKFTKKQIKKQFAKLKYDQNLQINTKIDTSYAEIFEDSKEEFLNENQPSEPLNQISDS